MKTDKKHTTRFEFSKLFAIFVSLAIFAYGVCAGVTYFNQVYLYYQTIQLAIENCQEYISIQQPDPQLAIVCVTTILASFLTYCLYQGSLKISLNSNKLNMDPEGIVRNIANGNLEETLIDIVGCENKSETSNKKSSKKVKDNSTNEAAG